MKKFLKYLLLSLALMVAALTGCSAPVEDEEKEDVYYEEFNGGGSDEGISPEYEEWLKENGGAEDIEDVVDIMIDIEHYLENGFQDDDNYVDLIQTWCQKKYGELPYYEFYRTDDEVFDCTLNLSDELSFEGHGYSKREARMEAAQYAYEYLEDENELILPIDEVGEPDFDKAINQLQELYQKGYIVNKINLPMNQLNIVLYC